MDIAKLESVAKELEGKATTTKVVLDGIPRSDPARQDLAVQLSNFRRWAQTIKDAIK